MELRKTTDPDHLILEEFPANDMKMGTKRTIERIITMKRIHIIEISGVRKRIILVDSTDAIARIMVSNIEIR